MTEELGTQRANRTGYIAISLAFLLCNLHLYIFSFLSYSPVVCDAVRSGRRLPTFVRNMLSDMAVVDSVQSTSKHPSGNTP
jgi:hypothetical protein